ncbi:ATP-dependent 3'-5' DNA helicase [Coemansia furcata]|nr:ATP-dependent 3'-5' DNA helicase [Coemansia furcata]
MDLVVTLRSRFKAFATVCVFLSLKSCSLNRPVQTVLQSVPSLTVNDIAVFCGVLGAEVLRLSWDADQLLDDPDEGDIQLHVHLELPQPEQADQRPAKRQRRSQSATDPVRQITVLISLFDTRLDALIADSTCDILFKRLASENLPLMPAASDTTDLSMDDVVDELRRQPFYCGQIVESASLMEPAIAAQYASLEHRVDVRIWTALRETRGIEQLYSHQAQAVDSIMGSSDVVVSTATASGKSIIYQLPIVDLLLRDPQARILIIYPTKALAQDQLAALTELVQSIPALRHVMVSTLDGDTPSSSAEGTGGSQRAVIRQQASVILTNPDTLHVAMLPGVERWRAFWAGLRMVVIDELHVYQGRFGQHMAHILSRMQRLATATHFQFVACSATTSNAQAHMQQLTNRPSAAIGADGSPHGTRHLVLWDALQSKGAFSDTALLAAYLLRHEKRALVFCRTRVACELAQREILDYLNASGLRELCPLVMSYRGGYSPRERREIEAAMFAGRTRIVVATSALELGIDVGALDAVIIVGVPMTTASLWQQIGRAGRRSQTSLGLVIATGAPADRHAVKGGAGVFGRCFAPAEIAEEMDISAAHLRCAAFERPIDMDVDSAFIGEIGATNELVKSALTWDAATQRWACPLSYKPWPAARVSIRSTPLTDDGWQVVVVANGASRKINGRRVLEEMDAARSLFALYVGGIFLHRGLAYTIDVVDADTRTALVTPANVSWHTTRRELTEVIPALALASARPWPHVQYTYGDVEIATTGIGYRRIDSRTRKVVETVDYASPRQSAKSRGVWIDLPADISRHLIQKDCSVAASIHGAQHALLAAICSVMGCAPTQLSTACSGREMPQCDKPLCLVVFELANAENGALKRSVLKAREVLECAYRRVAACMCDGGCQDCIHLTHGCREQNQGIDRAGAKLVLEWLAQDVF